MRPPDTFDIPDESEPEDNIPDAVADRLAWDADFLVEVSVSRLLTNRGRKAHNHGVRKESSRKGNHHLEVTTWTAVFPLVDRAKEFEARMNEPGWWVTDVVRKGRTVTFTPALPEGNDLYNNLSTYFGDMLMTVGYYGSDMRRKATLNGVKAPMSY